MGRIFCSRNKAEHGAELQKFLASESNQKFVATSTTRLGWQQLATVNLLNIQYPLSFVRWLQSNISYFHSAAARHVSFLSFHNARGYCRYQDDTSAFLCKSNTLWMINICWFLHSISIAWQCMQIEFLSLSGNVTGPNLKYLSPGALNWTEKFSVMLYWL